MTRRQRNTLALALAGVAVTLGCAGWWSLTTAATGTAGPGPVDALIVFGSPAEIDGTLSPMQHWRVNEAAAEFRRGVAPHVIFSGGAAANKFVESVVMSREAVQLGLPPKAVLTEQRSRTTVENLRDVSAIMQAHGWTTAELISSADHLPRIAVIAQPAPFRWRLHAAPTPGRGRIATGWAYIEEAEATLILRLFGSAAEPIVHAIAVCEHIILFIPRWIVWKLSRAASGSAGL